MLPSGLDRPGDETIRIYNLNGLSAPFNVHSGHKIMEAQLPESASPETALSHVTEHEQGCQQRITVDLA